MMCRGEWSITLVIVGARNLKNVSTLGKLDPFVRISYGKDVYQTTVLKDGGCSPIWNFEVSLTGLIPTLKVEVYDSRVFKDKLIGYVEISLQSLSLGVQNLAFSLHNSAYPGECTGVLLTKISVFSSINSSSGGPAPRRMSMPQLSSGPTLYPCITHACCCHYNSFPLPSPGHYLCTPVAPCARDSPIYPGLLQQEGLKASVLPVRTQPVHTVPLQKQMAAIPSY